jgi:hypothetical protein
VTVTAALALFFVPAFTAPLPAVIAGSAVGVLLAVGGAVTLWRWPLTAAACVFLTDYAVALWIAGPAVDVVSATGVGVALLLMLHSAELARSARRATVDARVMRSQIAGWIGFVAATLGAAAALMTAARVVAAAIPPVGAPLLAAAAALGVVVAVAAALATSSGRTSGTAS